MTHHWKSSNNPVYWLSLICVFLGFFSITSEALASTYYSIYNSNSYHSSASDTPSGYCDKEGVRQFGVGGWTTTSFNMVTSTTLRCDGIRHSNGYSMNFNGYLYTCREGDNPAVCPPPVPQDCSQVRSKYPDSFTVVATGNTDFVPVGSTGCYGGCQLEYTGGVSYVIGGDWQGAMSYNGNSCSSFDSGSSWDAPQIAGVQSPQVSPDQDTNICYDTDGNMIGTVGGGASCPAQLVPCKDANGAILAYSPDPAQCAILVATVASTATPSIPDQKTTEKSHHTEINSLGEIIDVFTETVTQWINGQKTTQTTTRRVNRTTGQESTDTSTGICTGDECGEDNWRPGTNKGSFDVAVMGTAKDAALGDLNNVLSGIKSELNAMMAIDLSVGGGSLGCSSTFNVLGASYQMCVSDYQDQLSVIGLAIMAVAGLIAARVILG